MAEWLFGYEMIHELYRRCILIANDEDWVLLFRTTFQYQKYVKTWPIRPDLLLSEDSPGPWKRFKNKWLDIELWLLVNLSKMWYYFMHNFVEVGNNHLHTISFRNLHWLLVFQKPHHSWVPGWVKCSSNLVFINLSNHRVLNSDHTWVSRFVCYSIGRSTNPGTKQSKMAK